ncbi:hypothetical protein GGI21_005978, partial [Coemansia aciculifera]
MNSKHMSLGGKDDWPRRRSPLPASMLYGTSPRRRKDTGSPSPAPSFGLCFAASLPRDALVPSGDNADFWDSDTVTPCSWSPQTGPPRLEAFDNNNGSSGSSGDESTLFVQIRQQRRAISELSKQLENREAELAKQIQLADTLKASADDAHRQAQIERQTANKHETQLRWHEEQLSLQGEEAKRQAMTQQAAMRMADKRHQAAIDRMLVRVAQAEDETRVLSMRVKDLSQKLDRAKALEEQSRCANEHMSKQILDARLAAILASQSSAELVIRLNERSVYIGQLENQVRALLLAVASHDDVRLPVALSTPAAFGLEPTASGASRSLHSEIAKATNYCTDEHDSDMLVRELAPLQILVASQLVGTTVHAGKSDEHVLHASHSSS